MSRAIGCILATIPPPIRRVRIVPPIVHALTDVRAEMVALRDRLVAEGRSREDIDAELRLLAIRRRPSAGRGTPLVVEESGEFSPAERRLIGEARYDVFPHAKTCICVECTRTVRTA